MFCLGETTRAASYESLGIHHGTSFHKAKGENYKTKNENEK